MGGDFKYSYVIKERNSKHRDNVSTELNSVGDT